jgi:N-acetylglucosamine-6-phosphate deacetylase
MSQKSEKSFLLRNARVVLPALVMEDGAILIENGRIASITQLPGRLRSDNEVDLQSMTIYPGFIDVHIHGAVGVDTMKASASDLDRVSQFLATRGVTGWMPTLVPAPNADYERSVKAIHYAMKSNSGARILGVHYEGPFVNYVQCGALRTRFFQTYSGPADLDLLPIPLEGTARRMITVAPEIEGGLELVRELTGGGWIVSVGHTRAEINVLNRAFEAGARHMTHFMNAMPPLHHRAPGPVGWGLSREDVTCDVIADGIHLDPFVLRFLLKTKGPDRLALISDAIAAAGKGDGAYEVWGETISVKDGRTSNARGSIAGSVISMIDAVRMMSSLGASEIEVARMASANPARLLGLAGELGSIEEGKRADLVALDPHGNVCLTVVGGSIAFQRE